MLAVTETNFKMALLVLIVLGATLGWLGSILAHVEAPGAIFRQIAFGLIAALVAGWFANDGIMLGGLSLLGLGAALAITIVALLLYHLIAKRLAAA